MIRHYIITSIRLTLDNFSRHANQKFDNSPSEYVMVHVAGATSFHKCSSHRQREQISRGTVRGADMLQTTSLIGILSSCSVIKIQCTLAKAQPLTMTNTSLCTMSMLLMCLMPSATHGFAPTSPSQTNPFQKLGIDVELPNFDELFEKIKEVSPLAKSVLSGNTDKQSLSAVKQEKDDLKWKRMEANSQSAVQEIEKIDNFDKKGTPLLRFRSSLKGPCVGEYFGKFIIDLEERKKWDKQVADVYEAYTVSDDLLDAANIAMGYGKYGDCSRLGIGYAQTKAGVISHREQLFMYGLQEFPNGSSILFGQELDNKHNDLLPNGPRHTRAKSHLFSATLTPTGEDSFDIEYKAGFQIATHSDTHPSLNEVRRCFRVAIVPVSQCR